MVSVDLLQSIYGNIQGHMVSVDLLQSIYGSIQGHMVRVCSPPVFVRVDDSPKDPAHKAYLHEVCKTLGVIEYRKFRQDWLTYQKCKIDVVVFCKRMKLLFRGER